MNASLGRRLLVTLLVATAPHSACTRGCGDEMHGRFRGHPAASPPIPIGPHLLLYQRSGSLGPHVESPDFEVRLSDGRLFAHGPVVLGVPEGTWSFVHEDGSHLATVSFEQGIPVGSILGHYRDGSRWF